MIKYATQQTYDCAAQGALEYVDYGDSITQEDESLSVKQILAMHVRGLPVDAVVHPDVTPDGFDDDDDLSYIDISRMDLAELDALRREVGTRISELNSESKENSSTAERSDKEENSSVDSSETPQTGV